MTRAQTLGCVALAATALFILGQCLRGTDASALSAAPRGTLNGQQHGHHGHTVGLHPKQHEDTDKGGVQQLQLQGWLQAVGARIGVGPIEAGVCVSFLLGAFVHAIAGFGLGMVATPILLTAMPIVEAVPILSMFQLCVVRTSNV